MPRRGENIYKRKDGRWEARYIKNILPDGTKKYASVYSKSYKQVKEKQRQAAMLQSVKSDNSKFCVNNIMYLWLDRNKNNIKVTTYNKYESIIKNHIVPNLGNLAMISITLDNLSAFSNCLLEKGLAKSTANDVLLVLNMGLSFAEKEFKVSIPKASFFRIAKKEMRVLSIQEQELFVNYLMQKDDIFSFAILLALFTGMRIGELCALKWDDIDEDKIKINKTMQRINKSIAILPPKTQSSIRVVPVPENIRLLISSYRRESGYLLQRDNGKYTEPRLLQMKFKKYTSECGICEVNFHALRHTFATRCVEAGFDIKTLSEVLGHSDVKTTLNKYVHSSMEQKIINMNKLTINFKI